MMDLISKISDAGQVEQGEWKNQKSSLDGIQSLFLGFPGGSVVENPSANTGKWFGLWSGKIPHA